MPVLEYAWYPSRPGEGTEVIDHGKSPCDSWELNLGPLEKKAASVLNR